ncbi:MAG: alpha-ketoacid dehydrogenase subunit beta [Deltaproteobacteria bacterium]|nr:alpha-ketoacid dehydrogenase subunit beta [Deltaproteobacteria bacterium]
MARINMVQAINLALKQEMEKDKDVVILGEDVGRDGGVFRITEGIVEKFPDRIFDMPLAESGIIGAAIGMAVYGLKPVAEIQFMGFTYAALEQLFSHAARIRSRSRGRCTCPMVLRTPYGIGIKAPELHSESTEALFCHVAGLKVVVPSTPSNAKGLLISAIRDPDPVIFLEPSRAYRAVKEDVPDEEYTIPLGKAEVVQEGRDITVVAWGSMLHRTLDSIDGFDADIEVIDLMTLSPFDEETVIKSVKKTGKLVIVHEAAKNCGLGAEISATIAEEAMLYLKSPIIRVAGFDTVIPFAKLEDHYAPATQRIVMALRKIMEY